MLISGGVESFLFICNVGVEATDVGSLVIVL